MSRLHAVRIIAASNWRKNNGSVYLTARCGVLAILAAGSARANPRDCRVMSPRRHLARNLLSRLFLGAPLVANGFGSRLNDRSVERREQLRRRLLPIAVLWCAIWAPSASAQITACASEAAPSEQLGELFRTVQLKNIFADSKTFADLNYGEPANTILADYQARKDEPGFDLAAFLGRHFSMPTEGPTVNSAA